MYVKIIDQWLLAVIVIQIIIPLITSDQMGKKGVLLDNVKKAQSSMALYWKTHK